MAAAQRFDGRLRRSRFSDVDVRDAQRFDDPLALRLVGIGDEHQPPVVLGDLPHPGQRMLDSVG